MNLLRTTVACFAAGVGAPTSSPCSRSTPRWGCPTRSPAGSPATRRTCWSRRATWPACSTRPAAPGTSSRSPSSSRRRRGPGSPRSSGPAGWLPRWPPGWWGTASRRPGRAAKRLAHRTDAITGVSEFPNLAEVLPERQPAAEVPARPVGCRGCGPPRRSRSSATAPTPRARARPSTWPRSARSPGTPRGRASPATFPGRRHATPSGDGAAGLRRGRTTVACICGTDKDYASRPPRWPPS